MNPFLHKIGTPFETFAFDKLKLEHFLPAQDKLLSEIKNDIEAIKTKSEVNTFYEIVEKLENALEKTSVLVNVFYCIRSNESNDEFQKMAPDFITKLTEFTNDIFMDPALFTKVKDIYDRRNKLNLTETEMSLVEKYYKDFVRNGALLDENDKQKVKDIDKEASKLKLTFNDNCLKETQDFELHITNADELSGLPENVVEAASEEAQKKGKNGWIFTLQFPSYVPFIKYSDRRDLREKIYRARLEIGHRQNERNNDEIIKRIANLRHQRAQILGFHAHSDFVLENRMAKNTDTVMGFLSELKERAKPFAQKELQELKAFVKDLGVEHELMLWDYSYYAEKLKNKLYKVDDEVLKPYFKLESVLEGLFKIAEKLYDIKFKERKNIPKYNSEVKTYEVLDKHDRHQGVLYADFFARDSKSSGAWMMSLRDYKETQGQAVYPHIGIFCNFPRPTSTTPSLLSLNMVLTLFHEFGHALHGLLSRVKYESLGGANVLWDFVELPSQIMENWVFEKECLDLFARHYQTKASIPHDLVEKVSALSKFHVGIGTMRQLQLGYLDMEWHRKDPSQIQSVEEFEGKILEEFSVFPHITGSVIGPSFGHIFGGGYSAGYYSYKWAEVLDADAFEAFKENGIFNKDVAEDFKEHILSKGASAHPLELYKRFRGRGPDSTALFKRGGMI